MSAITDPTALGDQLQAATADARRVLRDAARAGRGTLDLVAGQWLAQQADALRHAFITGTARICPHLDAAPRIVHAAVWAPGTLVCPACTPLLVPDPTEDTTCDRCRHRADPIHAAITAIGPILLGYGLCTGCATAVGGPPNPSAAANQADTARRTPGRAPTHPRRRPGRRPRPTR